MTRNSLMCAALLALTTPAMAANPPFPLAVYVGNPNGGDSAAEAAFEAGYHSVANRLGTGPSLVIGYVDYTQPVSDWVGNASWQAWSNAVSPVARHLVPLIGLPMASVAGGSPSPDAQYQAFASGQYDSVLEQIVTAWTSHGFHQLVFRPGWEMNIPGNTFVGSDPQSRTDWVRAFRRISTVLHRTAARHGASLLVVWNPNVTNYDNYDTKGLYPGDATVDVIGADAYADLYPYSDGGDPPTYHDWATGEEDTSLAQFIADPVNRSHYWGFPAATKWSNDGSDGHDLSVSVLIGFAKAHGKPFAIPESGAGNCSGGHDVCDDPTYPAWLGARLRAAAAHGVPISFVGIWDSNAVGNYEFSFESDAKPQEAASWGRGLGTK